MLIVGYFAGFASGNVSFEIAGMTPGCARTQR